MGTPANIIIKESNDPDIVLFKSMDGYPKNDRGEGTIKQILKAYYSKTYIDELISKGSIINNKEDMQQRLNFSIRRDSCTAASAIVAADPGNTYPLDFKGYQQYYKEGFAYDYAFKYNIFVLKDKDEDGDIIWEVSIEGGKYDKTEKKPIKYYRNEFELDDFINKARGRGSILI